MCIVVKETVQAAVARGTVVPWLGNEYAQMQVVRFDSGNKYFKVQHNDTRILVLYRQWNFFFYLTLELVTLTKLHFLIDNIMTLSKRRWRRWGRSSCLITCTYTLASSARQRSNVKYFFCKFKLKLNIVRGDICCENIPCCCKFFRKQCKIYVFT